VAQEGEVILQVLPNYIGIHISHFHLTMPIFFGARFHSPSASASLSQTETTQLLQTIWPELLLSDADLKNRNYAAFVKYLNKELHTFYEDRPAAGAVPCKAFAGLVQLLRDNRCVLQKDIVSLVGSTFLYVKDDLFQQAIDLALQLQAAHWTRALL